MVELRSAGRFRGIRRNCEFVPCLPARIVARYLADPRNVPYLLVWNARKLPIELTNETLGWRPVQAARLGPPIGNYPHLGVPDEKWLELRQVDGQRTELRVVHSHMPRGGGKTPLLLCSRCHTPRRAIYGRSAHEANTADWICRTCAGLRYASEGGALVFRSRWAATKPLSGSRLLPRPEVWTPIVFTSPLRALELGLIRSVAGISGHCKVYSDRHTGG